MMDIMDNNTQVNIRAVQERTDAAKQFIRSARRSMAEAAQRRGMRLKEPDSLHQDLTIMEAQISGQIGQLENLIILYDRLVQDIQQETNG